MNLNRKLTTRPWLFILCSITVFVLAGFIDFVPALNKGVGAACWGEWGHFFAGDYASTPGQISWLAFLTSLLALAAVVLGWVLHHLVGLLADAFARHKLVYKRQG
jgi:hypothetical protein